MHLLCCAMRDLVANFAATITWFKACALLGIAV